MPRFDENDSDVVVVVGSGAGGGTLANELCQGGVKTVVLEAGAHHKPDDFIDDEWPSFGQLAWLDDRTTSGSWRVATDFPSLPAWTCKTVGGTSVHWAGSARASRTGSSATAPSTGPSTARACSTGPSAWPTWSPTTTAPRTSSASPAPTASPDRPPTTTSRSWATGASARATRT